jgi:hypothetical protein
MQFVLGDLGAAHNSTVEYSTVSGLRQLLFSSVWMRRLQSMNVSPGHIPNRTGLRAADCELRTAAASEVVLRDGTGV